MRDKFLDWQKHVLVLLRDPVPFEPGLERHVDSAKKKKKKDKETERGIIVVRDYPKLIIIMPSRIRTGNKRGGGGYLF